jgi:CRP/FNR family cyclic AMP-dependent transcriptional regulator
VGFLQVGPARQTRGQGGPLGEPAHTLFLILNGFVKTSRLCEDGTEITIELLKYGDIAGAIPNRQQPSEHEETARAIGNVVVQRVLAHELRAAMEVNSGLAVFVAEYLKAELNLK